MDAADRQRGAGGGAAHPVRPSLAMVASDLRIPIAFANAVLTQVLGGVGLPGTLSLKSITKKDTDNMTTVARIHSSKDASWYTTKGEPLYEILKADGKGMRAPTLADAKKRGDLVPRVSTILRQLAKPELQDWLIEQAVLAVMTSKQNPGEELDAFIHRILQVERVQDQESATARDRGTDIHAALEAMMSGRGDETPVELLPWIEPAAKAVSACGEYVTSEKILVGNGYAGRADLIQHAPDAWIITDYKTTRKLPEKKAYVEAQLQLAAYAKAWPVEGAIRVQNVYISTIEPGKFVIHETQNWQRHFDRGFQPLLTLWQHLNDYAPTSTVTRATEPIIVGAQ